MVKKVKVMIAWWEGWSMWAHGEDSDNDGDDNGKELSFQNLLRNLGNLNLNFILSDEVDYCPPLPPPPPAKKI